jgi:hypothetical protein
MIVPIDAGRRNDSTNGIGVMDEVLAIRFAWPEINLSRQVSYLGPPE